MAFTQTASERLLSIYLALGQYPILSSRIRARMRRELFSRGIMKPQDFETEVHERAIFSQEHEGLAHPLESETAEIWDLRLTHVRNQLTDLYFSQNLTYELFEQLVREVLSERGVSARDRVLSVNPEMAPQELVFEQAMTIEKLPGEERARMEAHLKEAKVVLIRTLISDQLRYINVAKEWFTISDLAEIRRRKIGAGRIGGKAAGMLLASRIVDSLRGGEFKACLHTPESYFIGADEMYTFMSINNLIHWNDQKYKDEHAMRAEYPQIEQDFQAGSFQPDMLQQFQTLLASVGNQPLIVRSSSLLEDNFGTAFAGKYESVFLPNQDTPEKNLTALTRAIARVYATTLNPSALLYRRSRGLLDYDERMGLLVQVVRGERFGSYFLPHAAGVAFSRNLYRWSPQIRREDGFVRLVWGLGTRAVDRVGNDYPRLIALSHPLLRPSTNPKLIHRYSQQYVDLIDLEQNEMRTLPVHDVLDAHYTPLRYIAQIEEEDGYFVSLRSNIMHADRRRLVLTFDDLLRRTNFAETMREMLAQLERSYRGPVDMEFTVHIFPDAPKGSPQFCIDILQCRPQSHLMMTRQVNVPVDLSPEKVVFSTNFIVPQGYIHRVEYLLVVLPEVYFALENADRAKLARAIGQVNAALAGKDFICVGPGRWGSSNPDLGVPIEYGDIYNTRALLEITGKGFGLGDAPEPSLGTHFFQDLLESQIYPLALYLDDPGSLFNRHFFYDLPNHLAEFAKVDARLAGALRLVRAADYKPGAVVRVVMNEERGLAVAYIAADEPEQTYNVGEEYIDVNAA